MTRNSRSKRSNIEGVALEASHHSRTRSSSRLGDEECSVGDRSLAVDSAPRQTDTRHSIVLLQHCCELFLSSLVINSVRALAQLLTINISDAIFFCWRLTPSGIIQYSKQSEMTSNALLRVCFVMSALRVEQLSARIRVRITQPDRGPLPVQRVLEEASKQLRIPEPSMTVLADSRCLQNSYQTTMLLTSRVTYKTGEVPHDAMLILILRSRHPVRFKCSAYRDDPYFRYFGCRILFTFNDNAFISTKISMLPDRTIQTSVYIDSDWDSKCNRLLGVYKGIYLPPLHTRCFKLVNVVLKPFRRPFFEGKTSKKVDLETLESTDKKTKAMLIYLEFSSPTNMSTRLTHSTDFNVKVTRWRKEDSLFSIDSGSVKCIIPVRAYTPRASAFLEVFSSDTWTLTVTSIALVSVLVTFPHSMAAVKLMIALGISTLTAFEVKMVPQMRRHSISRSMILAVLLSIIQVVVVNVYKNEITSAFSQVESSTEIREMVRSHENHTRDILIEAKKLNKGFETRPFYARNEDLIRAKFLSSLSAKTAYCDADVKSLLLHLHIPVATYSKTLVFSKIQDRPESPLLWSKTIDTLLTYSLISLKNPYYLRGADDESLKLDLRRSLGTDKILSKFVTWENHKILLRRVYQAAFELKEGTVFSIYEALILLQVMTVLWSLSSLCCSAECCIRPRLQATLLRGLRASALWSYWKNVFSSCAFPNRIFPSLIWECAFFAAHSQISELKVPEERLAELDREQLESEAH